MAHILHIGCTVLKPDAYDIVTSGSTQEIIIKRYSDWRNELAESFFELFVLKISVIHISY